MAVVPLWIWLAFVFAFGCCIGSFLNVVVYRLPRDKSLISPPSACPSCAKNIRFYDNIPLFSWLLLGARCRYCKAKISPRYFVIELFTGLLFASVFYLYFHLNLRSGLPTFQNGGWIIFLLHIILLAGFLAASAIDLELWVIPISICWFVTAGALAISMVGPMVIDPAIIRDFKLLPTAGLETSALAGGAAIGLIISLLLLKTGVIKQSYESDAQSDQNLAEQAQNFSEEENFNHRLEMCRELLFLLPIILGSLLALMLVRKSDAVHDLWLTFSQKPAINGFFGSLWGYFIGCTVVWATRILGTFGFGKEAMGLGDVHLMGAAGAVIGPVFVVVAFFIAPFFGLTWAIFQMMSKKIRQIPYGPFLSLAVFVVMILNDWIYQKLNIIFYHGN